MLLIIESVLDVLHVNRRHCLSLRFEELTLRKRDHSTLITLNLVAFLHISLNTLCSLFLHILVFL